jgi:hypothetical protein
MFAKLAQSLGFDRRHAAPSAAIAAHCNDNHPARPLATISQCAPRQALVCGWRQAPVTGRLECSEGWSRRAAPAWPACSGWRRREMEVSMDEQPRGSCPAAQRLGAAAGTPTRIKSETRPAAVHSGRGGGDA